MRKEEEECHRSWYYSRIFRGSFSFSGLLYIPRPSHRIGENPRIKRYPWAGIEPGLPTMIFFKNRILYTKDLAEQLQISPLELTIWLESPIMEENPRTNLAVIVKERQSASQR